jgi:hypothetical protein
MGGELLSILGGIRTKGSARATTRAGAPEWDGGQQQDAFTSNSEAGPEDQADERYTL